MNPKNLSKKNMFHIFLVAAVILVVFLVFYFIHSFSRVTTDDAYIESRVHNIASKVSGTVKKIYVNDNQSVKKGDLLLEIDSADYQLKVDEAQAVLNAQKAQLNDAEAGIKTAMANLEIQAITLNQAGNDKKRAQALFKEGVIAKEKHEKILTAYNLAAAQFKASKQQFEKAKAYKSLEESLVSQRDAAFKIAQLNLVYTKVLAPSDGFVTKKSVEEGNQIQPVAPLMAIVALDDIWVVANYKETQLKNVKPGQQAVVKIDTYPGKKITGNVDSIMAGTGAVFSLFPAENALGNYVKVVQRIPVKIVLDKSKISSRVLRIGMSCIATIITKDE